MKDFFISYNKADRRWAEWIAWQLEAADYSTVIQEWDFVPGSDFVQEMDTVSRIADRTIAVLSPDYLAALFTQPEWHVAFASDPTGEHRKLVPIRVRPCEPEGLLKIRVYLDFVGLAEDEACKKLLAMARGDRLKPSQAPAFPSGSQCVGSASLRFPGSLPPICNLTLHRNPYFSGREKALQAIRETLISKSTAVPIQVIAGLGGVGKTQTALEYIYRNSCDYDLIWWLPAGDFPSLVAEYASLATALDLAEQSVKSIPEICRSVRKWLQQNGGWLLVFDDAQEWSQIQSLVPVNANGHTIVTSRNQVWHSVPPPILAERLERTESVEFLLKRVRTASAEPAADLSGVLGDLPLALEHAAAYIQSKGVSVAEYLDLFKNHQLELFGRVEPPDDYGKTILTTWDLAFQAVGQSSIETVVIMQSLAFLSSEPVPNSFFTEGPEEVGPMIDRLNFHDSVQTLRRYSLIQVSETGISMHPLVQAVIRETLPEDGRNIWVDGCISRLLTAFPQGGNPHHWDECAAVYPHVLAAASHAESMKGDLKYVGQLLHLAGMYLHSRGLLSEAKLLADRVVSLAKEVHGINHPDLASALNNRGVLLKELGDVKAAEDDYREALRILETRHGPNDSAIATLLNHQALVLMDDRKLSDALEKCLRALQIDEGLFGADHEAVARDLMTRGGIFQQSGRLLESLQDNIRALSIYTRRFGEENTYTLTALSNLARIQEEMGDLSTARRNHQKCLTVGERLLGPSHPNVATYLSNLAGVLEKLNDTKGAIPLYKRALAIQETVFGPCHPSVAIILSNFAHALKNSGDIQGAKDRLERAIAILTEFYGPDHADVRVVKRNLASLQDL